MAITKTICLVGNPNSGKTTLFNALTGGKGHVGNWAGVTVETKSGLLKENSTIQIVDLPGIYSLSPITTDEKVAYDYLIKQPPDLIINIVDSTNLKRNLFLTTQLAELGINIILALNMQDQLYANGKYIDIIKMREILGCEVVSISASKQLGFENLIALCQKDEFPKAKPLALDLSHDEQSTHIHLAYKVNGIASCEIACQRYTHIENIINSCLFDTPKPTVNTNQVADTSMQGKEQTDNHTNKHKKNKKNKQHLTDAELTEKIDKVVTNKWLAFPIFFVIMMAVFFFSIDGLGGMLTDWLNGVASPYLMEGVRNLLAGSPLWLSSLLVDGIMTGVLAIVGFVPQITLLFGCIALLEGTGYMSRIAFIMDRLLNKIGLSGKSFVSMIIGCGCSVPAIMSARTIKNLNERNSTITLVPFMPCSAKLALFSFFTSTFFGGNALVATSMYFISIVSIILGGLLLKLFNRRKTTASDVFLVELPTYKLPTATSVLKEMWDKGKSFLIKAGTIIFTASVVLWLLTSFSWSFKVTIGNNAESMLSSIGKLIAPLFVPLGFGNWQFAVATLSGLAAKETAITTLQILYKTLDITTAITPLGAYSFMVFNLLCAPCMATIGASFKEQGKAKYGIISVAFQTVFAYLVSLAIYQIGRLVIKNNNLFLTISIVSLIAVVFILCILFLIKKKGCKYECDHCPNNKNCKK
ncbi:MAG: ferrous iron transport protein B [Clostridia bacterium]